MCQNMFKYVELFFGKNSSSDCFYIAACLDLPCVPQQEWHCPNCKDRSDHARKTAAGELLSPSRPFVIRLTRVVKAPEMEIGGCVVCRLVWFLDLRVCLRN